MKSSEMKILKDYIRFKENRDHKYLVIDKEYVTEESYKYGQYTLTVTMPPNGAITHYEFGGDTAVGKLMELYKEINEEKKGNDK